MKARACGEAAGDSDCTWASSVTNVLRVWMVMLGMTTTWAMSPWHASCHFLMKGTERGRWKTTVLESSLSMHHRSCCSRAPVGGGGVKRVVVHMWL